MFQLAALILSLVPFTLAQSDTALQIEAIEAHFQQSGIVPSLLPTFNPLATLSLNFAGVGTVSPGQALTHDNTAPQPTVTVTAANSSVSLDGNFTITMVDADVVGTDDSMVNRHWMLNSVTISGGTVSNASAVAVTPYAGPGPLAGSGPHRYVVILYEQPASFSPPESFAPTTGVSKFSLSQYVEDSHLGPLLAATYFTVEEGTATVSISATSAVISSTLAPVPSGPAGTASSSASGSNPSASPSGSNAVASKASQIFTLMGVVFTLLSFSAML